MAVEQQVLDLTFKNSSAASTIPQFSVVHYDTTNAFGAVPPGNANAGPVAGINLSTDITSAGAQTGSVQVGSSMQVRVIGVSRTIAAGVTVIGAPLYVQAASGKVDDVRPATDFPGSFVGFGMEAGTADGDIISVFLNPGLQPGFKRITASVANSQGSFAHGLPYVPQVVIIKPKGNAVIWESQAADGTNVFLTASVAGPTNADVFVA